MALSKQDEDFDWQCATGGHWNKRSEKICRQCREMKPEQPEVLKELLERISEKYPREPNERNEQMNEPTRFDPATAEYDSTAETRYQDLNGTWFTAVKYYLNGVQVGTAITPN